MGSANGEVNRRKGIPETRKTFNFTESNNKTGSKEQPNKRTTQLKNNPSKEQPNKRTIQQNNNSTKEQPNKTTTQLKNNPTKEQLN